MPASYMPCSEADVNNMSEVTSTLRRKRRRRSGGELATVLKDLTEGLGDCIEATSTTLSTSFDRLAHEAYMI